MNTESIAKTWIGNFFIRIMAAIMESHFRYHFFAPRKILQGSDIHPSQTVLEIGCGTGFFTLPLAQWLGEKGHLISMDVLTTSVEVVREKMNAANLKNVRVIQGNALDTKLDPESVDAVLVFGVVPAPMLPMNQFLAETHRVLKPDGILSIWPTTWVNQIITRSGLFTFNFKQNGVSNFKRN